MSTITEMGSVVIINVIPSIIGSLIANCITKYIDRT